MSKIAVVYWSDTGNTEIMAKCIKEGIDASGKEAVLIQAADFTPEMCDMYSSIAFGCPAMGAEILEEDVFEPMFTSVEARLSGKNVVLFGSFDWGDGEWMREWVDRTSKDGAKVVCDLIIQLTPDAKGQEECREAGKKLANS